MLKETAVFQNISAPSDPKFEHIVLNYYFKGKRLRP